MKNDQNKITLYNSRVCHLMSKKCREVSDEICRLSAELWDRADRSKDHTLSHADWLLNEKRLKETEIKLESLKRERNVWDQAREICFQVADELEGRH